MRWLFNNPSPITKPGGLAGFYRRLGPWPCWCAPACCPLRSLRLWALSQERVMAPEMPNPSIVRSIQEFQSPEIHYFCVRHVADKKTTSQCPS